MLFCFVDIRRAHSKAKSPLQETCERQKRLLLRLMYSTLVFVNFHFGCQRLFYIVQWMESKTASFWSMFDFCIDQWELIVGQPSHANSMNYLINNGNVLLCGKYLISKFSVLTNWPLWFIHHPNAYKNFSTETDPRCDAWNAIRMWFFEKFWMKCASKQTIRPEQISSIAMTKLYQR